MSTHSAFRLSTHLTLIFAAAALGFAEFSLFREVGVFSVLVIVSLAMIYRLESRLEVLSISDANKLGAGIFLISGCWVTYRVLREIRLAEHALLGWQMIGMALFGAVLMLLIPAKLLRKEKHAGDWWGMHAMGLAAVALAGAMADDVAVVVMLGGYVVCGAWSLSELSRNRGTGVIPPVPGNAAAQPQPLTIRMQPERIDHGFTRSLFWVACAGAIAVPLYLMTPRSPATPFMFGNPRVEIGYAASQMIDLKRTGELEENPDPAFEVVVEYADGRPKTDLGSERRWRGTTLSNYNLGQGSWNSSQYPLPPLAYGSGMRLSARWEPPNFGPDSYKIHFSILSEDKAYFLADPVVWESGQYVPVATKCPSGLLPWSAGGGGSGSFLRTTCGGPFGGMHYVQFTREPIEPDLGTGFEFVNVETNLDKLVRLASNYPPRVKEYADSLLARLIREGKLPPEAAGRDAPDRVRLTPPAAHHEAIARAFSRHLAEDPEFGYTTKLRRVRPESDPIEEFLFDLKAGHCERFAAALVMMLRSQGIPAVLVLGFRGCEQLDEGKYVVRQQDAHAWVEALISRPGRVTTTNPDGRVWHWLSLDPTPTRMLDEDAANLAAGPFGRAWNWVKEMFEHYILKYTPARREQAIQNIAEFLSEPVTWVGVIAVMGVGVGIVALRRRKSVELHNLPEPTRWFARLVELLQKHGFVAQSGDTAIEFAATVRIELARRPGTTPVAHVPVEWAEAYYLARFGGTPLAPERLAELDRQLTLLEVSLRARDGE